MRILITTGIFKPEPGGPAFYSANLADKLVEAGHDVKIITYSDKIEHDFDKELAYDVVRIKRSSKILNYFRYFLVVVKNIKKYDIIYALDYVSVGIPVYLATRIKQKKYIIRIGGDFIWEKHVNISGEPITLKDFYDKKLFLIYKKLFDLSKKVLQGADEIIFNSDKLKELFFRYYDFEVNKVSVIHNAVPDIQYDLKRDDTKKEIVFFGRFIEVKNIFSVILAFSKLDDKSFRFVLIGDGPQKNEITKLIKKLDLEEQVDVLPTMHGKELWQRIINSYYIILPSWSDVSPNQVYECLQFDMPILLTQENYLPLDTSEWLKVDPKSVDDIIDKMNYLNDSANYQGFVNIQKQFDLQRSWDDVTQEHLELFKKL